MVVEGLRIGDYGELIPIFFDVVEILICICDSELEESGELLRCRIQWRVQDLHLRQVRCQPYLSSERIAAALHLHLFPHIDALQVMLDA